MLRLCFRLDRTQGMLCSSWRLDPTSRPFCCRKQAHVRTLAGPGASPAAGSGRGASATYASMLDRKSAGGVLSLGICIERLICTHCRGVGGTMLLKEMFCLASQHA